jgi:hypothetical protein
MRLLTIAALVFSIAAAAAAAIADNDTDAPATYHVTGQTVVTHHRAKPLNLKDYPTITWLDKDFTLQCVATQCLATSESYADASMGAQELCTYVDGKPIKPACSTGDLHNLQSRLVKTGTHTFQTGVVNGFTSGGTVCPCEVIYHLYDSAN